MTRADYTAEPVGLPYDLRLGVTGHRAIADGPALAAAVAALLDRIAATLDTPSSPLACTLVSPLAQGADRLVARAALDRLHAKLEVVTPFPLATYRADFESADDRAEFEALLEHAAVVHELPGVTPGAAAATISAVQRRDTAYARVGERVVDACEILIAVWNGRRAAGLGGTADIIDHALRLERLVIWIHAERPHVSPRIIRHITYATATSEEAIVDAVALPSSARELSIGYHQQAAYFNDGSVRNEDVRTRAVGVRETFTGAARAAGVPPEALAGIFDAIVPEFVRADALALRYQRRHVWVVNGILRLAALAAVTMAVGQVLFFPEHLWLSVFEVAAMAAVFGLWWGSRGGAWHEKWLHDRYLAEQLRAAMFTVLVGPPGDARNERTLVFYRLPKHWLIHIGHTIAQEARHRVPSIPIDSLRRVIVDGWLLDQQRFHSRKAHRKAQQAHRRHQLGFGLFAATLLMALLHMLGVGHRDAQNLTGLDPGVWITFFALVLPVWAGAVHAITSQLELERVAERSARVSSALAGLAQRAGRALTPEELAETAREASALMLQETHAWWVLLSFQGARLHV